MGNFPKIISGINLHLTSCFIMNNNIRVGVGFLIPALAIIAFFASVLSENYLLGIFFAIAGVLVWFLYAAIMQSDLPDVAGNVIILFGFLLSAAVFLNYGLDQNMFGGLVFIPEGAIFSILLLFFSFLLGVLFRNNTRPTLSSTALMSDALPSHKDLGFVGDRNDEEPEKEVSAPEGDNYEDFSAAAQAEYYSDYYDYYNEDNDE